jgi:hypothetical protein
VLVAPARASRSRLTSAPATELDCRVTAAEGDDIVTITAVPDARAASALPFASVDGVRLLHWPVDDRTRADLASDGVPRLLLVAPGGAPPEDWDDLEDWLRLPLDPDELRGRARTLRLRALHDERPWFDADGLLRTGDRWVDLPTGPRAVVELLVARFGQLVPADVLAATYRRAGGSVRASARKALIARVRRRLAELELELHTVRESGYLLDWARGGEPSATPMPSDVRSP